MAGSPNGEACDRHHSNTMQPPSIALVCAGQSVVIWPFPSRDRSPNVRPVSRGLGQKRWGRRNRKVARKPFVCHWLDRYSDQSRTARLSPTTAVEGGGAEGGGDRGPRGRPA